MLSANSSCERLQELINSRLKKPIGLQMQMEHVAFALWKTVASIAFWNALPLQKTENLFKTPFEKWMKWVWNFHSAQLSPCTLKPTSIHFYISKCQSLLCMNLFTPLPKTDLQQTHLSTFMLMVVANSHIPPQLELQPLLAFLI